ncbi:unnamed protein product [Diamesa serratosioi]
MTTTCSTKDNNCFHKTTHVIFDLDGTLMDTEKIYEQVMSEVVGKFGIEIPESLKHKYFGLPCNVACEICLGELKLPVALEELQKSYKQLALVKLRESKLCAGAERLIKHFHSHNIPMAIATNSEVDFAKLKIDLFKDLFGLIHHMVTIDDVSHGKPAPDMYLLAMEKFPDRPEAGSCLVFEDSPNGMKAAIAAKMQCVFVNEQNNETATLHVKTLIDFEPELFGLPPLVAASMTPEKLMIKK